VPPSKKPRGGKRTRKTKIRKRIKSKRKQVLGTPERASNLGMAWPDADPDCTVQLEALVGDRQFSGKLSSCFHHIFTGPDLKPTRQLDASR
jgi:hypothetical protein